MTNDRGALRNAVVGALGTLKQTHWHAYMRLVAEGHAPGVVTFLVFNELETVFLRFAMDFANGWVHTMLEEGGVTDQFCEVTEADVEHYTRYVHSVIGNALVELCIDGVDPAPCEIVIPHNIIPQDPEKMVALELERFRGSKVGVLPASSGSSATSLGYRLLASLNTWMTGQGVTAARYLQD